VNNEYIKDLRNGLNVIRSPPEGDDHPIPLLLGDSVSHFCTISHQRSIPAFGCSRDIELQLQAFIFCCRRRVLCCTPGNQEKTVTAQQVLHALHHLLEPATRVHRYVPTAVSSLLINTSPKVQQIGCQIKVDAMLGASSANKQHGMQLATCRLAPAFQQRTAANQSMPIKLCTCRGFKLLGTTQSPLLKNTQCSHAAQTLLYMHMHR
jgi:hypothetical protein